MDCSNKHVSVLFCYHSHIYKSEMCCFQHTNFLLCTSMMASVMNSVLLQSSLEKMGVQARLQTGIAVQGVGEPYNRQRATRHLDKGRVVIFGGIGATLGNPLLSSDAAAALRAIDSRTPSPT